jgi:uncharacterized protein YndB with AHSA1/START domain
LARYTGTLPSVLPPEEVFSYLADFRSVAEWDPSITSSELVDGQDPIRVGARFRVATKTTLSQVVLEYTTTELDRPRRIALRGENDSMVSIDVITIEPAPSGGGSQVTYDARIELKGARKLADPLLQLGFKRLGDKAKDGLQAKLNGSR